MLSLVSSKIRCKADGEDILQRSPAGGQLYITVREKDKQITRAPTLFLDHVISVT
jgi:hypothetical protein